MKLQQLLEDQDFKRRLLLVQQALAEQGSSVKVMSLDSQSCMMRVRYYENEHLLGDLFELTVYSHLITLKRLDSVHNIAKSTKRVTLGLEDSDLKAVVAQLTGWMRQESVHLTADVLKNFRAPIKESADVDKQLRQMALIVQQLLIDRKGIEPNSTSFGVDMIHRVRGTPTSEKVKKLVLVYDKFFIELRKLDVIMVRHPNSYMGQTSFTYGQDGKLELDEDGRQHLASLVGAVETF